MKIESLLKLPAALQAYFTVVKTLKAKEARKESTKQEALGELVQYLGEDKSVLIVTQNGLAVCDINPQAHAEFDSADTSPEIKAILAAKEEVKSANAKLAAAVATGKQAKKVTVTSENSIRLEILSPEKEEGMMEKFGPPIRAIRKAKAPTASAAA
jgi:hypothetical protein